MTDSMRWLAIQEAADRGCCEPRTLRRAVRSGRLRSTHIGGELRFLEQWIDEWLLNQLLPDDQEIAVAVDAAPSGDAVRFAAPDTSW
jgi:excisionase family DNA binding protein